MVDDSAYGTRDRRGDWKPHARIAYPPPPWRLFAFLRWLLGFPGYFLPWGLAYLGLGTLLWLYATPAMETMKLLSAPWIAFLLIRNAVVVLLVYGLWHGLLYIRRTQGPLFKLNGRWPAQDSPAFLFRRQTADNLLRTLLSGVPIWTAYEALAYWVFANGWVPWISLETHPLWFALLVLAMPALHDVHFYFVHRLLHWPPLYRWAHRVHHTNVNPGPWSGLAMHPAEHLLYFSGILLHLVIPSHPFHAMFHGLVSALGPARGHAGFERLVIGGKLLPVKCHQHYLHHKHFECNYGDGPVPLDKWMGTFHDGSPEAQASMRARIAKRNARMQAGSATAGRSG